MRVRLSKVVAKYCFQETAEDLLVPPPEFFYNHSWPNIGPRIDVFQGFPNALENFSLKDSAHSNLYLKFSRRYLWSSNFKRKNYVSIGVGLARVQYHVH